MGCPGPDDDSPDAPSILPPLDVSATPVSPSRIDIVWRAPSGATPPGYRVFRNGQFWTDTTTTSANDVGLVAGTRHCYAVASMAPTGDMSERSAEVCATTSAAVPPQFTVTVQRNGTGTGTVIGSGIDCGSDCSARFSSGTSLTLTATATAGSTFAAWNACDLVNGNTCSVNVDRDRTVTASFTAPLPGDTVPPTAPGAPVLSAGASSINVSWSASTDNVAVTGYRVTRGGVQIRTLQGLSFDDTGLASGTTYCYSVVAVDAAGNVSPASPQTCATTTNPATAPRAPTQLAVSGVTQSGAVISWTPGSTDQTGFEIGLCVGTVIVGSDGSKYCPESSRRPSGTVCASVRSYTLSGLQQGTEYLAYVVAFNAAGSSWAPVATFRTMIVLQTVLRIVNQSSYDIVGLTIGGSSKLAYPDVIASGQSRDFVLSGSGSVSYTATNGFWNSNGTQTPYFNYQGTVSAVVGVNTVTISNPTVGQLLSGFRAAGRNWSGTYYCTSCTTLVHQATFWFGNDGTWKLYDDGKQVGYGTVTLVSWPRYSAIVQFKICPTCEAISLAYPFAEFKYRNGPAEWPIISYVAQ